MNAVLRQQFVSILPIIQTHAEISFRSTHNPELREERVAETIAVAWSLFLQAIDSGRDPMTFASSLATMAVRRVRCGRRFIGGSANTTRRGGQQVTVSMGDAVSAVSETSQSPVPDVVAFRVDFPRWVASHSQRDQGIIHALLVGEKTTDVSRTFDMSPGRVSQLRRELMDDWNEFNEQ